MYQNIQAYPYQYPGVPPVLVQPSSPPANLSPIQPLPPSPPTPLPPEKTPPSSVNKPQSNGLRVFEFLHIGVMSLIGSFLMSSITHTKYSKVLPLNLLTNTLEAFAVSALVKGKVPSVNKQLNKIGTPSQEQTAQADNPSKKTNLPFIVGLINATSCLALTIIYMLQGKMKDHSTTPVSNQALQDGFRTFIKGIQKQPKQISKLLPGLMQLSSNYVKGNAFFRFMNRNPVLAVLLPVLAAAISGYIEGKASTHIADKAGGRVWNPVSGHIQNNPRAQL